MLSFCRALVRKLIGKGVLSPDDVRALLFDAVKGLDLVGSELTPAAARIIVEEDLVPVCGSSTGKGCSTRTTKRYRHRSATADELRGEAERWRHSARRSTTNRFDVRAGCGERNRTRPFGTEQSE
jgi:hypothetical protein